MRNLDANFRDSFQLSLPSKFEIIGEIALSKLQNIDRILQFLFLRHNEAQECECSLHWTVDRSPQPKKPRRERSTSSPVLRC